MGVFDVADIPPPLTIAAGARHSTMPQHLEGPQQGTPVVPDMPRVNPFQFGALEGLQTGLCDSVHVLMGAWKENSKDLMGTAVPSLDKVVQSVKSAADTLQHQLDLLQQGVQACTNTGGHDERMACLNELGSAIAQLQNLATNLQNVRNGVPFMCTLVCRLLAGVELSK
jgi:hypothetical protein